MAPLLPVTMKNRLEIDCKSNTSRGMRPFHWSIILISAHLKEWQFISDIRYSEMIY